MLEETLTQTLLLLGVTLVILLGFRRLGVPASLGYLVVGILLSSKTAGPVIQSEFISTIAEFGIVFLLFSIGLSFSVAQIYALRHTILGLGTAQVALTTIIVGLLAWAMGLPPLAAFVVGAIFAQSSTTVITKQLLDQGESMTRHGRLGTTLSVFQDITAVPFVVIIPVLGAAAAYEIAGQLSWALVKAALAFVLVLTIGRRVLQPLFQVVARGWSFELFTLTVLFVSLAAAFATKSLGLSMAFGAFLAGMILGETEFRHQVEAAIRPFRDVLLGLLFVSIGMLVDPAMLPYIWHLALAGALALLLIKLVLVTLIVRVSGVELGTALRTGMVLAVGGEFGFALLALALQGQLIADYAAQIVLNAVFFSMILGAFLIRFNQPLSRWLGPGPVASSAATAEEPIDDATGNLQGHVVLCGYGRIGQVVSHFLQRETLPFVALDIDPAIVREARLAAQPVYFGDSSDLSVLESTGLDKASLVIVSHDDLTAAIKTIRAARTINPQVPIVARTRDETHLKELLDAGATEIIPETLEAGMMIALHAMMFMQVPTERVTEYLQEQRNTRYALVRELFRGQFGIWKSITGDHRQRLHSIVLDEASPAVGRSLGEADAATANTTITTLVRDGLRLEHPDAELRLQPGDVLVLLGDSNALDRAESLLTGRVPS